MSFGRVVAAILCCLAAGGAAVYLLRDRTPVATAEIVQQNRAAWEGQGIKDYELSIQKEIDRAPPEVIVTSVREGKVIRLTVGAAEVPPRDSYTVAGLFDLLEAELERLGGQGPGASGFLQAAFEEKLGAPLVVKRIAPQSRTYVIRVLRLARPDGTVLWEKP